MGATAPERHREVAVTPLQSDLTRATPGCRSRRNNEKAPGATSRSDLSGSLPNPRATLPQRRGEVARVFIPRSDQSQRPLQVAPEETTRERLLPATTGGRSRPIVYPNSFLLKGLLFAILSSKLDHPRSNSYAHEFSFSLVKKVVRSEARKVHNLFFDLLKMSFPDTEARNALSFSGPTPSLVSTSSPRGAGISQGKRPKPVDEGEPDHDDNAVDARRRHAKHHRHSEVVTSSDSEEEKGGRRRGKYHRHSRSSASSRDSEDGGKSRKRRQHKRGESSSEDDGAMRRRRHHKHDRESASETDGMLSDEKKEQNKDK
ncbi:hypothetical protein F2Q69_00055537 [Brassica cretica]|uniref:Uncharacterized protein n=1 Tax=Brassica cretica TaxID=69181 RepID=A0A8S9ML90_BRACR|nr:hypothetical protein F2Q69_00055537 [Brassica cretica]